MAGWRAGDRRGEELRARRASALLLRLLVPLQESVLPYLAAEQKAVERTSERASECKDQGRSSSSSLARSWIEPSLDCCQTGSRESETRVKQPAC